MAKDMQITISADMVEALVKADGKIPWGKIEFAANMAGSSAKEVLRRLKPIVLEIIERGKKGER